LIAWRGRWLRVFVKAADPKAKIAIVGNRADLVKEGEEVEQKAREFAKEKGYAHYRVSAKTGEGIDTLFQEFTASIFRSGLVEKPTEGKKPQTVIRRKGKKDCSVG
jgi:tRNA U34 5-carboxymethylaminomethyl modifying GTPase MnmE/TrmE